KPSKVMVRGIGRLEQRISSLYSPAWKREQEEFYRARGFLGKAGYAVKHPALVMGWVAESAPTSILAAAAGAGMGAIIPRLSSSVLPFAASEGAVQALSVTGSKEEPELMDYAAAAASGSITGAISFVGARVANKLGIDPDVAIASLIRKQAVSPGVRHHVATRVLWSMASEGILEELPQSAQEQIWENYANRRPLLLDVPESAIQGMFAGMVMGGGMSIFEPSNVQKNLDDMINAARDSRLRADAPEAFSSYIRTLGNRYGITHVYLQSGDIVTAAKEANMTLDQMNEWLSGIGIDRETFTESYITGQDISIAIESFLSKAPDDRILQNVRDRIRMVKMNDVPTPVEDIDAEVLNILNERNKSKARGAIEDSDVTRWKQEILGRKELKKYIKPEHLDLYVARANMLASAFGGKPIDHLNRMLRPNNIIVTKYNDFTQTVETYLADIEAKRFDIARNESMNHVDVLEENTPGNTEYGYRLFRKINDSIVDLISGSKYEIGKWYETVDMPWYVLDSMDDILYEPGKTVWAKVEYDTSDVGEPSRLPGSRASYRGVSRIRIDSIIDDRSVQHPESSELSVNEASDADTHEVQRDILYQIYMVDELEKHVNEWMSKNRTTGDRNRLERSRSIARMTFNAQTFKNIPSAAFAKFNEENVIALFSKADRSSFIHETGHLFLEDLKFVAENYGTQQDLWRSVSKWLGVGEDGVITRDMHEKFARHFEAYLMTGKAPSNYLKRAFRAMRKWLIQIYNSITGRRRLQDVQMNEEIRSMMYSLLATEAEIDEARETSELIALHGDEVLRTAGLTPEQVKHYKKLVEESGESVKDRRSAKREARYAGRIKEWRERAMGEAMKEPLYRMIVENPKAISYDSVRNKYGREATKHQKLFTSEGGQDVDIFIAENGEKYGFSSTGEFISAAASMPDLGRFIRKKLLQYQAEAENLYDSIYDLHTANLARQLEYESEILAKLAAKEEKRHEKKEKEINQRYREAQRAFGYELEREKLRTEYEELKEKIAAHKEVFGRKPASRLQLYTLAKYSILSRRWTKLPSVYELARTMERHRRDAMKHCGRLEWEKAFNANEKARAVEMMIIASRVVEKKLTKAKTVLKRAVKATAPIKKGEYSKIFEPYAQQIRKLLTQYRIAVRK
ncbi:MAG: hypothetical protein N3A02_06870, partial [Rectinema sp.]|nr:hypothetical protein [Rectinema sp.]